MAAATAAREGSTAEAVAAEAVAAEAAAAVAARGASVHLASGDARIFKRAKYDADAECEALQSCRAWI